MSVLFVLNSTWSSQSCTDHTIHTDEHPGNLHCEGETRRREHIITKTPASPSRPPLSRSSYLSFAGVRPCPGPVEYQFRPLSSMIEGPTTLARIKQPAKK